MRWIMLFGVMLEAPELKRDRSMRLSSRSAGRALALVDAANAHQELDVKQLRIWCGGRTSPSPRYVGFENVFNPPP